MEASPTTQRGAWVGRATVEGCNGVSVVIPVYNSATTLRPLLERLQTVCESLGRPYELIFVNDGSRDNSWQEIVALANENPALHGIDLMRNYGQHNALLCGIRAASYNVTVTLDDDLQNPPEEIPRLMTALLEGYDVVYGAPAAKNHGLFRNAASELTRLVLQESLGAPAARQASSFRVFRTPLRDAFSHYSSPEVSIDVLLTWGAGRIGSVPVSHHARAAGRSNYTFRKLVSHALTMATGFSLLPLRLATIVGFTFTLVGVGVFFYVLVNYLIRGAAVPGFTFLASIIAVFAGVQLFALGIFGEYLARVHFRTMGRPVYQVRHDSRLEQRLDP